MPNQPACRARVRRAIVFGIALAAAWVLSGCGNGSSDGATQGHGEQPGALDPSFGNGGVAITSKTSSASAIALQPDGKIVVAAGILIRYDRNGTLDVTFGKEGFVDGTLGGGGFAPARVALQSDGKIVAAGSFVRAGGGGAYHCALVRYSIDGTIDPGFGADGLVAWDVAGDVGDCTDVAIEAGGNIVVAIHTGTVPLLGGVIARFAADGSLDRSFGSDGTVRASGSIAILPDRRILASWPLLGHGLRQCELARFEAGGAEDASFGEGGHVSWKGPFNDQAPTSCALALQPDGKVVVVSFGSLARFLEDGSLDARFGGGGMVSGVPGVAVAVQPNGKIVVVGGAGDTRPPTGFAVWRFDSSGRPDSGFGNGGIVNTPLLDIGGAEAVAIQANGRILAAGWAESTTPVDVPPAGARAALARYFGD